MLRGYEVLESLARSQALFYNELRYLEEILESLRDHKHFTNCTRKPESIHGNVETQNKEIEIFGLYVFQDN